MWLTKYIWGCNHPLSNLKFLCLSPNFLLLPSPEVSPLVVAENPLPCHGQIPWVSRIIKNYADIRPGRQYRMSLLLNFYFKPKSNSSTFRSSCRNWKPENPKNTAKVTPCWRDLQFPILARRTKWWSLF